MAVWPSLSTASGTRKENYEAVSAHPIVSVSGLWQVLVLACLPALGNFAGGLCAEFVRTTPRLLNVALHTAAGIMIAVVAVEIMPEALNIVQTWAIALSFLLGGSAYLLIEAVIDRLQGDSGDEQSGIWMIYIAVSVDLFSDGLLIGAGTAISFGLAFVLAIGQVMADIPEGFATIANFREKGVSRFRRLTLAAAFAVPVLVAALLGYFLLRGQSEAVKLSALVFTAGLLTIAAVEEMIREAHESAADTRASVFAFAGGFALFTLVSGYFEAG